MQEQMNSTNDSGEIQEVESNHSGRLSYDSSQPAMIPSCRSMRSRDRRLPLDTWNTSGLQGNVFGNQFSTFDPPRNHPQGIHPCAPQKERGSVPRVAGSGTLFARDDKHNIDTIPMPTFTEGRRLWVRSCRWSFRRIQWLGSKYRNCNSTNSIIYTHFWFRRYDSRIKWLLVLIFRRDPFLERIFQILRCWTRRLLLLWTRSSRTPTWRKRSIRRTGFHEEDRSPS